MESKHLFVNCWSFVGFAHELSKVGDIKPIQVAGHPLLLKRSSPSEIIASYNVCSHRDLKLITDAQNCKN